MQSNRKKLLILTLSSLMIFSGFSFAEEGAVTESEPVLIEVETTEAEVEVEATESEVQVTYTLDELIDMALEQSEELKLLEKKTEDAKQDNKLAQHLKTTLLSVKSDADEDEDKSYNFTEEEKRQAYQYPIETQVAYDNARQAELVKQNEIELEVTELYYSVLLNQEQLANDIESVANAKRLYEVKQLEYDLGNITAQDKFKYKNEFDKAKLDQISTMAELDSDMRKLNWLIGQPIESEIALTQAEIPRAVDAVANLEVTVQNVLENSFAVATKEAEMDAMEQDLLIMKQHGHRSDDRKMKQLAIDDKAYEIEKTKTDIEYDIRTKYNEVQTAQYDIRIKEQEKAIAENAFNTAQIKYDNEMISELEYNDAVVDYEKALNNLDKAILDHFASVEAFNNYLEEATFE